MGRGCPKKIAHLVYDVVVGPVSPSGLIPVDGLTGCSGLAGSLPRVVDDVVAGGTISNGQAVTVVANRCPVLGLTRSCGYVQGIVGTPATP